MNNSTIIFMASLGVNSVLVIALLMLNHDRDIANMKVEACETVLNTTVKRFKQEIDYCLHSLTEKVWEHGRDCAADQEKNQ